MNTQIHNAPVGAQLDALALIEQVRRRLVEYSLDANFVHDEDLRAVCRLLWGGAPETGGLVSDLWVEGAFPAKLAPETLTELARRGDFSKTLAKHLHKRDVFPDDRHLYQHQRNALLTARAEQDGVRPAVVVTAGTGAGKTESFLLPILDRLWQQKESAGANGFGSTRGIRCLILYPMNALVNDQMERLHKWLTGQQHLSLFHFTGETPEDDRDRNCPTVPAWTGNEEFRVRSRKEARGLCDHTGRALASGEAQSAQPDILVTNYSMLEYMLCRPQDGVFFGDALEAIVLDEAHLYSGTLAAEITLLLRRVLERCGRRPEQVLQIATSATLGGSDSDLTAFISTLFSKPQENVHLVRGEIAPLELPDAQPPDSPPAAAEIADATWLTGETLTLDAGGNVVLCENTAACDILRRSLPILTQMPKPDENETFPARLLYAALGSSPFLHSVAHTLWERKRLRVRDLAALVWHGNESAAASDHEVRAVVTLLQLGATARRTAGELPILPHRLHILTRATSGLVACLNPNGCPAPAPLRMEGLGGISAGTGEKCPYCTAATARLFRCGTCGEWALATIDKATRRVSCYTLRTDGSGLADSAPRTLDKDTGQIARPSAPGVGVRSLEVCPHCADTVNGDGEEADTAPEQSGTRGLHAGSYRPFVAPASLTLSIVAETAITHLPPFPDNMASVRPAGGRRVLAFSDSRSEAARLGFRLTRQHEAQQFRAIVAQQVNNEPAADAETLADLDQAIADAEAQVKRAPNPQRLRSAESSLKKAKEEKSAVIAGNSLLEWRHKLRENAQLSQLLEPNEGGSHEIRESIKRSIQSIFDANHNAIREHLPYLLAREFVSSTRTQAGLESVGLVEVVYPGLADLIIPPSLAGTLPVNVRTMLEVEWPNLAAALLDTLREDGAITLQETANEEPNPDDEYDFGNRQIGIWMAKGDILPPGAYRLERFTGATARHRRRLFISRVLQTCGVGIEEAEAMSPDILKALFTQLLDMAGTGGTAAGWLEQENRLGEPALRLRFWGLALRRPATLHRSPCTGLLYPRSVRGYTPHKGAIDLEPFICPVLTSEDDPWQGDVRWGRQRTEYLNSPVFAQGLWAEEHSAQLSAKENRRLQDLFKAGMRNLLSSTTTMELGIDIGGLNAVLMGNVPPGKANYLQRAGRAGRRSDGSSVVITFARLRPYDSEVFQRFGDYLGRELRRPVVQMNRERITRRHLHALLLGNLFAQMYARDPSSRSGAMNAFGRMGVFCGARMPDKWESGANPPPSRILETGLPAPNESIWWNGARRREAPEAWFCDYLIWAQESGYEELAPHLRTLFAGTPFADVADASAELWQKLFQEVRETFSHAVRSWRKNYEAEYLEWTNIVQDDAGNEAAPRRANRLRYQLLALANVTVIEALADRQFLPRYGFPIGVQSLRVQQPKAPEIKGRSGSSEENTLAVRTEDLYRLARDGAQALREYVPGAKLMAGGKIIVSHGLMKHWTGANIGDSPFGLTGRYATCENKHFYYSFTNVLGNCPICQSPAQSSGSTFLIPEHGYTTAAWEAPRRGGDFESVGFAEPQTATFSDTRNLETRTDYGGVAGLKALYKQDGELVVFNKGKNGRGFALCLKCGYADSEPKENKILDEYPSGFKQHAPLWAAPTNKSKNKSRLPFCLKEEELRGMTWRWHTFAARQTTDVLMLDWAIPLGAEAADEAIMLTLAYALQTAAARLLELDTREIGVLVTAAPGGSGWGTVLYDTAPGGAGHVQALLEPSLACDFIQLSEQILRGDAAHDKRCETACLDCILTYDAQMAAEQGKLARRRALASLQRCLLPI